ncbi:MAG: hypothetical protein EBZ69_01345 [Alphaproteobacteria bacterium]|nr:hypothetical protein [Alphaproteobacteria bacterium]
MQILLVVLVFMLVQNLYFHKLILLLYIMIYILMIVLTLLKVENYQVFLLENQVLLAVDIVIIRHL